MKRYQQPLRHLLAGLRINAPVGDLLVTGITSDSREIKTGDLFVALKGAQIDARRFVVQALEQGAAAVLVDADDQPPLDESCLQAELVVVSGLRQALSLIAARFYEFPGKQLKIVGVTGTNGKTTIAWCLAQVLRELGMKTGIIGTLGAGTLESLNNTGLTTPDAVQLQAHLAGMHEVGVEIVCLEVSSHALELGRINGLQFEAVVFSNLSQDHLDFHQSMAKYAAAKKRLFNEYTYQYAVLNLDDAMGRELTDELDAQVITYGVDDGNMRASNVGLSAQGLAFTLSQDDHRVAVNTTLIGDFNVYNLLAVSGVAVAMGYALDDVAQAIDTCRAVPGRMERIDSRADQPVVVVDYAHTPDALDKALAACRGHCAGSLSIVFGCGGDRDRAKRPEMGRIAEQAADTVYITDDNPRSESAAGIVEDITQGMHKPAWILHDRAAAIRAAVKQASAEDWVLIAGKGHETRQVYADRVIDLDDRDLAQRALQRAAA